MTIFYTRGSSVGYSGVIGALWGIIPFLSLKIVSKNQHTIRSLELKFFWLMLFFFLFLLGLIYGKLGPLLILVILLWAGLLIYLAPDLRSLAKLVLRLVKQDAKNNKIRLFLLMFTPSLFLILLVQGFFPQQIVLPDGTSVGVFAHYAGLSWGVFVSMITSQLKL
jgi:hypothetical protein